MTLVKGQPFSFWEKAVPIQNALHAWMRTSGSQSTEFTKSVKIMLLGVLVMAVVSIVLAFKVKTLNVCAYTSVVPATPASTEGINSFP